MFKRICETYEYEVREYGPAKWVSTEVEAWFLDYATYQAFWRLYGYITGENHEGKNIEMTSPVLVEILKNGVYKMSFLLPSEFQRNPPKPTDKKVYLIDMPGKIVYVRSFGGWLTHITDVYHSYKLSSALDSSGAMYQKSPRYAVGYNSPMTLFDRHNEVWYMAEGKPVCPSPGEQLLSD
ncbi:heme-binding protein 2 [Xyrichtys novacula]|nr:heme-binding protein 2 [Xyrichtys novacula]